MSEDIKTSKDCVILGDVCREEVALLSKDLNIRGKSAVLRFCVHEVFRQRFALPFESNSIIRD